MQSRFRYEDKDFDLIASQASRSSPVIKCGDLQFSDAILDTHNSDIEETQKVVEKLEEIMFAQNNLHKTTW